MCGVCCDNRWRDFTLNLSFAADRNQIICELQLVHSKMNVARKAMAGHRDYVTYRSAVELRKVRRGVLVANLHPWFVSCLRALLRACVCAGVGERRSVGAAVV